MRIKNDFQKVDTSQQLKNIEQLQLYDYELSETGGKRERGGLYYRITFFVSKTGLHKGNSALV